MSDRGRVHHGCGVGLGGAHVTYICVCVYS